MFDSQMTFNGLLVYDVATQLGFKKKDGLALKLDKNASKPSACHNWWTRSRGPVKRSVFMEDDVYAISDDTVRVASTKNLDDVLKHIDLNHESKIQDQKRVWPGHL